MKIRDYTQNEHDALAKSMNQLQTVRKWLDGLSWWEKLNDAEFASKIGAIIYNAISIEPFKSLANHLDGYHPGFQYDYCRVNYVAKYHVLPCGITCNKLIKCIDNVLGDIKNCYNYFNRYDSLDMQFHHEASRESNGEYNEFLRMNEGTWWD